MEPEGAFAIDIVQRHAGPEISEELLRKAVAGTLAAENISAAEISLALTDDTEIHRINRDFLKHDYPTDVISFTLSPDEPDAAHPLPDGLRRIDGELVISVETARREADAQRWSLEAEVVLYAVHGLLHLCGYDDQIESARLQMRRREREIMSLLNMPVTEPDADVIGLERETSRRRLV